MFLALKMNGPQGPDFYVRLEAVDALGTRDGESFLLLRSGEKVHLLPESVGKFRELLEAVGERMLAPRAGATTPEESAGRWRQFLSDVCGGQVPPAPADDKPRGREFI